MDLEVSMRRDIEERYGFKVPDDLVIMDLPDYFSYYSSHNLEKATIVGWNRNTEVFWRNVDHGEE